MPKLDIDNLFKHHPPTADQVERYNTIRRYAKEFAEIIVENTPESAEQTLAIRSVHQAMMNANSAIACGE